MSFDHFGSKNPVSRKSSDFDDLSDFQNDRFSNRDEDVQRRMATARESGAFDSKASIFDYLFFTEGLSVEEAEQKATKIAAIRGVPDISEKPKKGVESAIEKLEVVFNVAEKYPWAKDLLISVASAAIGAGAGFFAGKEESKSEPKPIQPNLYQQVNNTNEHGPSESI